MKNQLGGDDHCDRPGVSAGPHKHSTVALVINIDTLGLAALMEAICCQMVEEWRGAGREGRGILHLQIHPQWHPGWHREGGDAHSAPASHLFVRGRPRGGHQFFSH